MRFGFFFFAEYVGVFVLSALTVVLFFGGWNSPIDPRPDPRLLPRLDRSSLNLASLDIWLLWALVIGVPLIILWPTFVLWTFKSSWGFLKSLVVAFLLFNVFVISVVVIWAFSRSRSSSACSGSWSRPSPSPSSSCGCAARFHACASTS